MRSKQLIAVALAAAMVLSLAALGTAAAGENGDDDKLSIHVEQAEKVTVTVTNASDGDPVENATVNVSAVDEDATYDGAGEYTTDADGAVSLSAPNETVEVSITASDDGATATTKVTLEAIEADDDPDNFGAEVSQFVHDLLNGKEIDGGIGSYVSAFAVENNPGNASGDAGPPGEDERGPPSDAGPDGDDEADSAAAESDEDERGPPSDAGSDDDDENERGPPSDAGPDGDEDSGPPS